MKHPVWAIRLSEPTRTNMCTIILRRKNFCTQPIQSIWIVTSQASTKTSINFELAQICMITIGCIVSHLENNFNNLSLAGNFLLLKQNKKKNKKEKRSWMANFNWRIYCFKTFHFWMNWRADFSLYALLLLNVIF